ncbi:MAG: hypothetical protein JHD16_00435 [Solirubrobacteraceae bacterium]|nr:hypothetical protein [Solirubrobacteraceae bacterium]
MPTSTDLNATHARKAGGDALRRQQAAGVNAEAVRRAFGGTYRDAIEAIFGAGVQPGDGRHPPQRTFR